jgi:hypothetical protein
MKRLRKSFLTHAALALGFLSVLGILLVPAKPAQACDDCFAMAIDVELEQWITDFDEGTYWRLTRHVRSEMTAEKIWMISIFWEDNLLPALMLMAEQLTAVAMQQMEIVGAFLDAKHQLETQQLLQRIAARTHKDYHPSVGLCEFGSGAKSLAASERKAEMNAVVLSQRSQDRQLGAVNTAASIGDDGDKEARIRQFREKFCDPFDNNNGLSYMCDWDQDGSPGPNVGASNRDRMNKDVDYIRTVDAPWTLDVDFVSTTADPFDGNVPATTLTDNEEEIIALASNLYGENVFVRPPAKALEAVPNQRITNMQKLYLDMRSIIAKRAVAENSFNAITAMKSEGTPGSKDYLVALMRELGVSQADALKMLGDNPSYYAQMEILTKKIYHNPDFYTNLYDKPANVDRKGVAMQAIALMQKFDLFKSYLRNEASLSVLLELAVMDLQEEAENEINQMRGEGTPATR